MLQKTATTGRQPVYFPDTTDIFRIKVSDIQVWSIQILSTQRAHDVVMTSQTSTHVALTSVRRYWALCAIASQWLRCDHRIDVSSSLLDVTARWVQAVDLRETIGGPTDNWVTFQPTINHPLRSTSRSIFYGTPEGTFLFRYLPEKKSKQKELERKSKQ